MFLNLKIKIIKSQYGKDTKANKIRNAVNKNFFLTNFENEKRKKKTDIEITCDCNIEDVSSER